MGAFVSKHGHKWTAKEATAYFDAERWLLGECEKQGMKYTFGYIDGVDVPFSEGYWVYPSRTSAPCSRILEGQPPAPNGT